MCFIDHARWILGYLPRYRKRHLLIVYSQQCQTYQTYDWCLWTETIDRSRGPVSIWRCQFSAVGSYSGDRIIIKSSCLHDGIPCAGARGMASSCRIRPRLSSVNRWFKSFTETTSMHLAHHYALDIIEMGHRCVFLSSIENFLLYVFFCAMFAVQCTSIVCVLVLFELYFCI